MSNGQQTGRHMRSSS